VFAVDTVDALRVITRSAEPNYEPGARYLYTNTGWVLAAQIVYSGSAECVRDVLIDGEPVLRDRELLTLDERSVLDAANRESERIAARVG
jgi:hypothetical protein